MLGLVTEARLREFKKDLDEEYRRKLNKLKEELGKNTTLQFSSTSITIDDLVQRVVDRIKPDVQALLKDLMNNLDITGLSDKAWDELDMESLEGKIAELVRERVMEEIKSDPDNLISTIADKVIEDSIDTDDIASQVADNITERIQLKPAGKEE